jgi:hypothetical protein
MKLIALFMGGILCSIGVSAAKISADLSDMERDALALELFLQDKNDHRDHCPNMEWDQPSLEEYKRDLRSHLPEGCKS